MKHQPLLTGRALGYRQFQVLNYVRQEIELTGQAPTYSMICEELGIDGRGNITAIIKGLEKRGLLSRVGKHRPRQRRVYRIA